MNSSHRKIKEEERRRIAAIDAFQVAEKSNEELNAKLAKKEKERKFVATALNSAKKQAESQWLLPCRAKDRLTASKEQIAAFKRKLEEVGRAKEQANKAKEVAEKAREDSFQEGYEIGVAKTKDALRSEEHTSELQSQ